MPRPRLYLPLRVLLNNEPVGLLTKDRSGGTEFRYEESWLTHPYAVPVSLSLPLREDPYRGAPVNAVFENILPDSEPLRRRLAERVGARGTDAYSLLSQIGRDCVGALQFVPETETNPFDSSKVDGTLIEEREIEKMLRNLARAPLGVDREEDFRISIAGAQEKTALLFREGKWWRPHGATPTTHIFKTQMGQLPNGMDLSDSIENEFYCLRMMAAFGLPVNHAEIRTFGKTKALVVERFDRRWTSDGRLLRLPQEDFCQALSVPPTLKYQSEGGPGMVDILAKLGGADNPSADQRKFLKAQILFWLMAATDGHAKNFSVHLGSEGRFRLTPFYDVLSAQPSLDAHQIARKQVKLAMSAGKNRHYRIDEIEGRHFVQTADLVQMDRTLAKAVLQEVNEIAATALKQAGTSLPRNFPEQIHTSIQSGIKSRLAKLQT